MKLGTVLSDWRAMNRKTVREAAKEIGIAYPTLSRIEHGMSMDGTTLAKILNWLTAEAK